MAGDTKTKLFEQAPRPALRPFIKRFLVVEFPAAQRDTHLPDLGPVAAFTFRGRCLLDGRQWAPAAALTGMRQSLRTHEHIDNHSVLLASFEPMGAAAFLRAPLEQFSGITADLSGILAPRHDLDQLHERIARAPNHCRRIQLLEEFLVRRLRVTKPDVLIAAAVKWIGTEPGIGRMDRLARYIGLSQSALERRFRRTIGLSPKKFASIVRLRHATRLMSADTNLAAIATSAGYFDQAHFINDFRRATGTTPTAFLRSR